MLRPCRSRHVTFRCGLFVCLIITMVKLIVIPSIDIQEQSNGHGLPSLSSNDFSSAAIAPVNTSTAPPVEHYRQYAERHNQQQFIHNHRLFAIGAVRYVLLVQVHTRIAYLSKFIEMLRAVEAINETLLIFSHDFIDEDINALVTNITFAPVIQIFYPFSQQLYPNEFPGFDPADCPRDLAKPKALASGCKNAAHPDRYGHYREVSIVQIKHHWWWKLNFVFNSIDVLRNRTDFLVLLLEEDFYLSPDALVFLKRMEMDRERLCPTCLFYTLGNLEKSAKQFNALGSKVSTAYWHARYNLGMTISHEVWSLLLKYAEDFCTVDDYNWDWSMVYVAQQRFRFPRVMVSSAARVVHLGSCGIHHKKFCSNESDIARWTETAAIYQENRKYLFPTTPLLVHAKYETKRPFKRLNGGWSDLRDQQLCLSFAFKDTKNLSSIDINTFSKLSSLPRAEQ